MRSRVGSTLAVLLVALAACWHGTAPAQIPDKYTNLRILPKTTKKDDLVSTMRQFSLALGVRCNHCHVSTDSTKPMAFDFASDTKKAKRVARIMMTMTSTINTTLASKTGIKDPTRVRCVTCHHGVRKPEPLTELLKAKVEEAGVDAARLHYQELRARYYGTGAYDFSPRSLQDLAEWLVRGRSDADGAISVLHLSAVYDPDEAETFGLMGMIQATKGDKPAAIETLKHALELDPENRPAQELLKALQSGE